MTANPHLVKFRNNSIKLIGELRHKKMIINDIAQFLHLSVTGALPYPQALINGGIAAVVGKQGRKYLYQFVGDETQITAFLDEMDAHHKAGISRMQQNRTKRRQNVAAGTPPPPPASTGIHIMEDDVYHAVKLHKAPAARDSLVAALFGAA